VRAVAASVVIEDTDGNEIPLDSTNPIDFGTVGSGSSSDKVPLQVSNDGDEDVFFVTVRGILHPDAQVGEEDETAGSVEFSKTQDGDYSDSVTWDELAEDATETFWARWDVPSDAAGGDRVWAIEAAASTA